MLRLMHERITRGLTLSELSYRVRIHPATLGKLESRKLAPYKPHIEKLTNYFNLDAKVLFNEMETQATKDLTSKEEI